VIRFVEPRDLQEACAILAGDQWGNKLISGGTALVLMMRQGLIAPSTLVNIGHLEGMDGIATDDTRITIGARATHTEIATSPEVRRWLPALADACGRVGNVRVRNVGTLGGNLAEADYAADPPTVLVGLDAVCHVTGSAGSRDLPVADLATGFYSTSLSPGEIITSVSAPIGDDRVSAYEKYVSRSSEDRPCVGVFATARYDGSSLLQLSVVVGAAVAVPRRCDDITGSVAGSSLDDSTIRDMAVEISEAIDPIEDARGTAWYRRKVTAVLVRRAVERVRR
jgi:aerobic carbon-monoxide dehydrogenase medium subunit